MHHQPSRHTDRARFHRASHLRTAAVAAVSVAAAISAAVSLSTSAWSDSTPPGSAPPMRDITFPVLGPVNYSDDYGDCRDECARHHQGNDLIGVKMQPLVAAVDGTVTRIHEDEGNHGIGVTITDAEGWSYTYLHVNNDAPGDLDLTDPGADRALLDRWDMPTAISVGAVVRAGQVIAWMGNSGNAEHSVPHLHFQITGPDAMGINPFPSLRRAEWADRCAEPATLPERPAPVLSPPDVVAGTLFRFATSTGLGSFTISSAGGVLAEGDASMVGDPNRTNPPCDGNGPVLTARTLPVVESPDTSTPDTSTPDTSTPDRGTLPPDIEDGRDG